MSMWMYLTGYADVTVDADGAAPLLELCRRRQYVYTRFIRTPKGGITLRMNWPTAKRVMAELTEAGVSAAVGRWGGLPRLGRWCRHRWGLVMGLVLAGMLLFLSTRFVWDVRITGNETMTETQVKETLAACGFGVGTSLKGLRVDQLQNRVLLADPRIAWISVNMTGTVAYVQIRETQAADAPPSETPSNVVATRSGTVAWVEMGEGNLLVRAGDVVKAGELLVSGLYDSYTHGYRMTHATAKVYAYTAREMEVTVPLSYEKKVYTTDDTAVFQEKILNFFGKSIKFSKSTGNVGVLCDTIEEKVSWGVSADVGFPISTVTVTYVPYTLESAVRTPDEAEIMAYDLLAERLEEIPDGILLSQRVTTRLTEDALILSCTVECIENIARVVEIGGER